MKRRETWLGVSGALFFLVTFAVLLIPHESIWDDPSSPVPPATEITAFFQRNYAVQQSQTVMHILGAVALLVFVTLFSAVVRRVEGGDRRWSRLSFGAGVGIVTLITASMGLVSSAIALVGKMDGTALLMTYTLGWDLHFKLVYLMPLFLVPSCVLVVRTRVLPRGIGWTGVALGAIAFVASFANLSAGLRFAQYPVFMLFMAWVLAASITVFVAGVAVPQPHSAGAPLGRRQEAAS